jgi:hypothetical protein
VPDDPRDILAASQRRLVEALTRVGEAPPDGFDAQQIRTAAAALAVKRMRSSQKAWPALHIALGERFEALFRDYAERQPLRDHGEGTDAQNFLAYALGRDDLTDWERIELLPLRAGRGWPIRCVVNKRSIAVAVRVIGRGVRLFRLGRPPG